jgi:DNA replication and repair protein RecF
MLFDNLRVKFVRNINDIQVEPGAGLNLIVGPNASGKTALLEAIHLLSRARSFRTPRIKEVIQRNKKTLLVTARLHSRENGRVSTGIEKGYGITSIRFAGDALKTVSEQVNNIPLVVITPDSHTLITGAPGGRRHWLDWAMFHVEPGYVSVWRNYQKSLRNRNNLLKKGAAGDQIRIWENSMLPAAKSLDDSRQEFVEKLTGQLSNTRGKGFGLVPQLSYYRGCPEEVDFDDYLQGDRDKDRQRGYTRYGPHKADIYFNMDGHFISVFYSRGQIKRFVIALLMAQARTYEEINGEKPVLLMDDYAAELDVRARQELLGLLKEYDGQVFLTSTEPDRVLSELPHTALFHVEHGLFSKVVK